MTQINDKFSGLNRLGDIPILGFLLRWIADIVRLPVILRHIARHVQMVGQRTSLLEVQRAEMESKLKRLEENLAASANLRMMQALEFAAIGKAQALEFAEISKAQAVEFAAIRNEQVVGFTAMSKAQAVEFAAVRKGQAEEVANVRRHLHQLKNEVSEARELLPLSANWDAAAEFVSQIRVEAENRYKTGGLPDGRQLVDQLIVHEESLKARIVLLEETLARNAPLPVQQPDSSAGAREGKTPSFHCYVGDDRVLAKTQRGLFLVCDSRDLQIAPAILSEGVWEKVTTALYERLIPAGGKYLEIGANVGYFTTLAASYVGHYGSIFAYEPNPRAFRLLQENLRINRQSYIANLRAMAVADTAGKRILNAFVNNLPSSTLSTLDPVLIREMNEESSAIEIQCTTLDIEFGNTDWKFDVVKIDAEGSEPLILAGASRFLSNNVKSDSILILEWNPIAMRGLQSEGDSLLQCLTSYGFQVFKVESVESLRLVRGSQDLDHWGVSDLLATRTTDALRSKGFRIS